jgi:hypothetical protein
LRALSEVFEALQQPRAADASDVPLHGRQELAEFHACHDRHGHVLGTAPSRVHVPQH